jgi:hypothetical protein
VIYRATSIATPTTTGFSIVTSVRNVNGRVRVFVVEPFRQFLERLEWTPTPLPGESPEPCS